jgi:hypothetical protein
LCVLVRREFNAPAIFTGAARAGNEIGRRGLTRTASARSLKCLRFSKGNADVSGGTPLRIDGSPLNWPSQSYLIVAPVQGRTGRMRVSDSGRRAD